MGKNKQKTSGKNKDTTMARKKKEKASTGNKNQGKQSPTSAVPPDQRQPKDRDPFLLERTRIHKELTKPLTVSYLRKLCHKAANEVLQGNELFRLVQDAEAMKWSNDCETFDAVFKHEAQPGNQTCAQVIDGMFVAVKNSTDTMMTMVLKAFDDIQEHDVSGKRAIRELTARIASQIPTDFFKLEEAKIDPTSKAGRFWDLKNPAEPRLNTSLNSVIFWVIASVMLNHPWRANYHDLRNHVEAPHVLDAHVPASPASVERQQSLFSFWTTPKRSVKDSAAGRKKVRGGKQSERLSQSSNSSHSSASSMIEDEEMNAGLPPPGQRIEEAVPRDDDEASFGQNFDGSEEEKSKMEDSDVDSDDDDDSMPEPMGTRTKSSGWKKAQREDLSGKSINLETASTLSTDHDSTSPKKRRITSTPTRIANAKAKSKSSVQFENNNAPKDDEVMKDINTDGNADEDSSSYEPSDEEMGEAGWNDFDLSGYDDDSLRLGDAETDPKPYREAVLKPKKKEPASIEEKLKAFQQVDMDGMSCAARFFEVVFALSWSGSQSGKAIGKAWVKTVVDTLAEILKHSDAGLRILPFDDKKHKNKKLHIRNEVELRARIKTFADLKKIIDMNFGNARSAQSNNKAGEKQLRTRMKFGFDREHQPDEIQKYLHDGLKETGVCGGCYPSPIQFGEQVRVGFLCFYPQEMNVRAMEKELMRHFKFKTLLGLKYEWVQLPFEFGKKWSDRQPGIRLWHIYARKEDAAKVDRALRQWLHPNTPKKDFPWAAVCHYVSDWRATEAGAISVTACGLVKDNLLTMVSKARDFQNLTTVVFSEAEFPGMLKKAQTSLYGSSTLLKILLSIKASPAQAAVAEKAATTDGDETEEEDEDEDDIQVSEDQADFVTVKSKKKRKSTLREALEAVDQELRGLTSAQAKAEKDKEMKLVKDRANNVPSPLFLMVLPGEMLGTYILVSRIKYTALAKNVLTGIVPFLSHHLAEDSFTMTKRILAKWISHSWIHRAQRRNLVWCTETLREKEANASHAGMDDGLDFLEFGRDITDAFQGTLTIDLEMAEAKDIDDGATVAGAMEDFLDSQRRLSEAQQTIQVQETALVQSERELEEKTTALELTKEDLAKTSDALTERDRALEEAEKKNEDLQRRLAMMLSLSSPAALNESERQRLELAAKVEALESDRIEWMRKQSEEQRQMQEATMQQEEQLPASPPAQLQQLMTNSSRDSSLSIPKTVTDEATATSTLASSLSVSSPPVLRTVPQLSPAALVASEQQRMELEAKVAVLEADRDRLIQQQQVSSPQPGPSSLVTNLETPLRTHYAHYPPPPPAPNSSENSAANAPNVTPPQSDNVSRGADGATAGA